MPDATTLLVLVLATYRLVRLAGWDDFPLAAKLRAWVIGEYWVPDIPALIASGERVPLVPSVEGDVVKIPGPDNFAIHGGEVSLPGKQPQSEADAVRPVYDRPLLAHLLHCGFCSSIWIALCLYGCWLWQPHWTLVGCMPFVLSGAVGLIAKNLDP